MARLRDPLPILDSGTDLLPDPPPGWATREGSQAPEEVLFLAGAVLAGLHPVVMGQRSAVPRALLADRLAFAAAEASLRMLGRPETLGNGVAGPKLRKRTKIRTLVNAVLRQTLP